MGESGVGQVPRDDHIRPVALAWTAIMVMVVDKIKSHLHHYGHCLGYHDQVDGFESTVGEKCHLMETRSQEDHGRA